MKNSKLSVVLPVRDGQDRIVERVERVLDALTTITTGASEVVVVDDGSKDGTAELLSALQTKHPQVRVARHIRPRGMEASGQTGLERATGDVVFIQETDSMLRIEDLHQLKRMSEDESVVAARAESTPRPFSAELLRRLRAWGTNADQQLQSSSQDEEKSSMQMIRRPHLQTLAGPKGSRFRLEAETIRSRSVSQSSHV